MVPCPICGEKKMFRSATNAVQHVESVACGGCKGKEKAREQIYKFISNKEESALMQQQQYGHCGASGQASIGYSG